MVFPHLLGEEGGGGAYRIGRENKEMRSEIEGMGFFWGGFLYCFLLVNIFWMSPPPPFKNDTTCTCLYKDHIDTKYMF